MTNIILIAGQQKHQITAIRQQLRLIGYDSLPCNSVPKLIEEMKLLPTCNVHIPLVILTADIVLTLNDNPQLCQTLKQIATQTPFLLTGHQNIQQTLQNTFENLCQHREPFKPAQNPELMRIKL